MKNLEELVRLSLSLSSAIQKSLADDSFDVKDFLFFIPVITKIKPALEDLAAIPEEIKNMSEAEHAALVALVKAEFSLPDEKIESAIEIGIEVGLKLLQLALLYKA